MIKYSVIMPMYNAINFIEKNLKNFEKLNRDDIELIIINDGSTDKSIEKIEKYKDKIKNLILINQENNGVSYSRNVGIKKANGKYITFLDCDDSLENDIFDKLDDIYNNNYDLIRYGLNIINKKNIKRQKVVEKKEIYENFNKSSLGSKLIYTTNIFNTLCNETIKRQILCENEIYFNPEHKYGEDFEFNRKLVKCINKICFLPDCLYNYYSNENSTSRKETKDNVIKCIDDTIHIHTQSFIECKEKYENILKESFKNISLEFLTTIRRLFFIKKVTMKEIMKIFNELRSYKEIEMLCKEKKIHNWKSNLFIDTCIYNKPNYAQILFFKYFFKMKEFVKYILY